MYLPKDEIESIQLDHTTRCNLMCPQCARVTDEHVVNPFIADHKDLTVTDYEKIFTPFIGKPIQIIQCGNYGDALASPTFDEVFDWCNSHHFITTIMTNGSLRNIDWWEQLAKKDPYVVFSVDGLEDTNHLYRVNSNFKKIKENMIAFASAGGRARWDFLVFEHNQHQVEEARDFAKMIGIKEFNVKNTSRFVKESKYVSTITTKKQVQISDIKENANASDFTKIVSNFGSFDNYAKNTTINCKYQQAKRYYIDFNMRVWPCCWVGAPYLFYGNNIQKRELLAIIDKFGQDFNDLNKHTWDEIISHEFYNQYLTESWTNQNRIFTCGRTCGEKFEFSSGYGKNREIKQL